jgi:hypothetical protein
MITYDNLAKAGLPAQTKTSIRQFYEQHLANGRDPIALAKLHANAAGQGLRAGGEAILVGGVLGAAHAHLRGGLDVKKVPIDAVAGVLGIVAGTFAAQEEVGKDLANAGAACLAVFSFRKTQDLVAEIKLKQSGITPGGGATTNQIKISKAQFGAEHESYGWASGSEVAGDFGEDPVVTAARGL